MKTAIFPALRQIEIIDTPEPRIAGPNDVKVRVELLGVCGSDVHYYAEGGIGPNRVTYPMTLGHESAGVVVETGNAVTRVVPGDRVAVDPSIACGTCDQCRIGRAHTCRTTRFLGSPNQAPGAGAEYTVVPEENCFPIADSLSLDDAVMSEPASVALYGLHIARVLPFHKVVIFGAGPIGLSVLLCMRAMGHKNVYVIDQLDYRLEKARECGATWTANPRKSDVVADLLKEHPLGFDFVLECTGDPVCIDQGARVLSPGKTLVQYGIPSTQQILIDPHRFRSHELMIQNVRRQNENVEPILKMMEQGLVDTSPLVTHHFPLEDIQEAFEMVDAYADGVVKAMVTI